MDKIDAEFTKALESEACEHVRRKHDELLLLAILVAGLRACLGHDGGLPNSGVIVQAMDDLAEIRRQLKGEG